MLDEPRPNERSVSGYAEAVALQAGIIDSLKHDILNSGRKMPSGRTFGSPVYHVLLTNKVQPFWEKPEAVPGDTEEETKKKQKRPPALKTSVPWYYVLCQICRTYRTELSFVPTFTAQCPQPWEAVNLWMAGTLSRYRLDDGSLEEGQTAWYTQRVINSQLLTLIDQAFLYGDRYLAASSVVCTSVIEDMLAITLKAHQVQAAQESLESLAIPVFNEFQHLLQGNYAKALKPIKWQFTLQHAIAKHQREEIWRAKQAQREKERQEKAQTAEERKAARLAAHVPTFKAADARSIFAKIAETSDAIPGNAPIPVFHSTVKNLLAALVKI